MKKLSIAFLGFVFLIGMSLNVLAATGDTSWHDSSIGINGTTVNLSNGVHGAYYSASGTNYSAATYNEKGNQEYGAASGMSTIKWNYCDGSDGKKACGDTEISNNCPVSSGDSSDFKDSDGWNTF